VTRDASSLPQAEAAEGPLTGVRIVETGQLLAGPFCGQLLGDLGAEVIKIEPPGSGDPMRQWGREKPHGQSLWWPVVARNKKSVTVNLRTGEGQDLVRRLAATADVLVENFRPGTLERWGLGYDRLSADNPRLILTRVTGFGQSGPYAPRAGYGSIGEAMGGLRYVTGEPDRAPSRAGISIGDSLAATFACIGTLAALHERERSGRGQVVDSAIYEAVLAMMESLVPEWQVAGYQRERTGAILPNIAPSNLYPTADGQTVLIAANQDTVFARLAAAMGEPELARDERYVTHGARGAHQQELDDHIAAWTAKQDADDLLQILDENGVPAGRTYRAQDMLRDPHMAARGSLVRVHDPRFGELAMQNVAPRLSRTPGGVRWTGPELGEHTHQVLGGLLGLSPPEIDELAAGGHI
jgi:formyl-CoA transferase